MHSHYKPDRTEARQCQSARTVSWYRILAATLFLLFILSGPGLADFDPPAAPPGSTAIKEHVELLSVEIEDDGDYDGFFGMDDAGTIQISTTVSQPNHGPESEKHQYGVYHPNKDDANTTSITINQPIYRHIECRDREEPLDISFKITELDTFSQETIANVSTTVRGDDPGKTIRQNGAATFTFLVLTSPVPAHDPKCAAGQPRAASSQIAMRLTPAHPFADAGSTATVAIAMTGISSEPVAYRLALEPLASRRGQPNPAKWSSVSPSKLVVQPGATAEAVLTINVPDGLEKGEYPFQVAAYAGDPIRNEVEFIVLSVRDGALPQVTPPYQTEEEARAEDRKQALAGGAAVILAFVIIGFWISRRRAGN